MRREEADKEVEHINAQAIGDDIPTWRRMRQRKAGCRTQKAGSRAIQSTVRLADDRIGTFSAPLMRYTRKQYISITTDVSIQRDPVCGADISR